MIKFDDKTLNSMSKAELIEAIKELIKECSGLQELIADKNITIKSYNFDRFLSKRDNAYKDGKTADAEEAKEASDAADGKEEKAAKAKAKHTGRPTGSASYSKIDFEEESKKNPVVVLDPLDKLPESEKGKYVVVHDDVTYLVEYQKAVLKVTKYIRKTYKKKGTENEFLSEPSHAPARNCIAGPGLLADILMMKYGFGVPHYRYVSWFSDAGFPIDTQTLYRWTAAACDSLLPLYRSYRDIIKTAQVVHIDETPVRTLDAEGRVNGYIFVFSAIVGGKRYRYYHFSADRTTGIVSEVLGKDFRGLIVVDGYDGYDRFSDLGMGIQRCLVHAARKWKEIQKGLPKKQRPGHESAKIVGLFENVFHDEEVIRQIGPKTAEERLKLRNDPERKKHVSELVAAIEGIPDRYAEDSPMYKAAKYFLNDKEAFLTFTRNGLAPTDNSEAERTVKPYALARRNFLFVRGKNGGDCSAVAMTMIENAKNGGLEPLSYMQWALSDAYKGNADHMYDSPEVPDWVHSSYKRNEPKSKMPSFCK